MNEHRAPIAAYDGQLLPATRVAIPYWDLSFAQGVSAVEQIRTYGGRLPILEWHLRRLQRGLVRLRIDNHIDLKDIRQDLERVVSHNHQLEPAGSDLGVCIVVSPGSVGALVPSSVSLHVAARPKVLIHTFSLPLKSYREQFEQGIRLATSTIRETPQTCLPKEFKHRSRINYYLAQQEIDERSPGCRALLETLEGNLADSVNAGILIYQSGPGWLAPSLEDALQSVTVSVVEELAGEAHIGFGRRRLSRRDVTLAQEILWCSTPTAILPVVEVDGSPVGDGRPGPQFQRIATLWSAKVGLDYRRQVLETDSSSHRA